ncbi:MAG: cytochrome P450 [Pseudomonadales bacterium]
MATDLTQYNLTDPQVMEDPYPFYAALHAADASAVEVPGVGYWVGRMKDVHALSRNTQVFSNSYFGEAGPLPTGVNPEPVQDDVQAIFDRGPAVVNALWTTDPPIHSQHRKLVNKAFTSRWVSAQEPGIAAIAHELIDGFIDNGHCEFIRDFAVLIPLLVIADALGVPRDKRDTFKHWSDDILSGNLDVLDHGRRLQVAQSWVEATGYFADVVADRRGCPHNDLISALATAEVNGESLRTAEILPIISTLLLAGNETTTNLIGNGLWRLLEQPELEAQLRANRDLIPAFLEEVLRHDAPVQCLYRVVTEDTVVGDVQIPKGSNVMLGWGCAGRDPDFFERPDEFDWNRPNLKEHVAFGYGPHLCVGLGLARAEARIAFEVLFDRIDKFALSADANLTHLPTFATRGFTALPLTWDSSAHVDHRTSGLSRL